MLVTKWYHPRNIRSLWFGEGEGEGGEGEGAGEGGAEGEGGGVVVKPKPGDKKPPEKKFSQEEVDKIVNKRFAKEKEEKEKLIGQLKSIQDSASLTAAEKESLAHQIDELQASIRTKEETAAVQLKTVEQKYQNEVKNLSTERDTWKNRFSVSTIRRSLTDAAVSADAEETSQIVMMFESQTRLEEVKGSDGKPTGEYITMMRFQGIDPETKKPAMLDMPPTEALQHMRENGLHKNLFRHGAKPGTGTNPGGGGKPGKDPSKEPVLEDYASREEFAKAYQRWRDDYNLDGTPKNKK